jgi:hypothetical protein
MGKETLNRTPVIWGCQGRAGEKLVGGEIELSYLLSTMEDPEIRHCF